MPQQMAATAQTAVTQQIHINFKHLQHQMLYCKSKQVVSDADCCAVFLGSSPGEDMDVCKCIVPSRHGRTLSSRRAASPFVRLVEGEERWETPNHPQGVHPQNWGKTELNRSVTCMVLKTTANDMRPLALCHDEFRGPLYGLCRSGGTGTTTT
ncbi:uncharacterized protein TNCV_2881521 [Trichonephila clavipes]|nr:uncharacterized protein TNCV_2881521 [Trichonephila clavipes]